MTTIVGFAPGESLALISVGAGGLGVFGRRSPPWRRRRGAPTIFCHPTPPSLRVKTLRRRRIRRSPLEASSLESWQLCPTFCCLASFPHRRVCGCRGGGLEFVLACRGGGPGSLCSGDPMWWGCGSTECGRRLCATKVARSVGSGISAGCCACLDVGAAAPEGGDGGLCRVRQLVGCRGGGPGMRCPLGWHVSVEATMRLSALLRRVCGLASAVLEAEMPCGVSLAATTVISDGLLLSGTLLQNRVGCLARRAIFWHRPTWAS